MYYYFIILLDINMYLYIHNSSKKHGFINVMKQYLNDFKHIQDCSIRDTFVLF